MVGLMSEPAHAPPGPHGGKGTVSIPGVGKLPVWAVLAGVGVVVVLIIRNKSASSSTAAGTATDPAGNVGIIDPATGYVVGSPQDQAGLAANAAASTASTGGTAGTSTTDQITNGPPFTSNAAWSQYAISVLSGNGYDAGTLSAELGAYLSGQPVTTSQQSDINAAIAVAGWPPVAGSNGQPPGIHVSGSTTSTGGTGTGAASAGAGTPAPTGTPAPPSVIRTAPTGFRVVNVTNGDNVALAWNPVKGATGYVVAYGPVSGSQAFKQTVGGGTTSSTIVPGVGAGSAGKHYFELWATPAATGGPHAGPIEATTTAAKK
jgi:hypothetical protein